MSPSFNVAEADPRDLAGISKLLDQTSLQPDKRLWEQYCETVSECEAGRPAGDACPEASFVIVDKIGVVRGFFIVRQRRHPTYHRLLDVPIIAIEKGPSEHEIARATFDYLMDLAKRQQFDALRIGCARRAAWEERLVPDSALRLTGTIMPLNTGD